MDEQKTNPEVDERSTDVKMFTSDEVTAIVQKRLDRYKAKLADEKAEADANIESEMTTRSAELDKRELELDCKTYLIDNGLDIELAGIISADNLDDFKQKVDSIGSIFRNKRSSFVPPMPDESINRSTSDAERIKEAFSVSKKHKPKQFRE